MPIVSLANCPQCGDTLLDTCSDIESQTGSSVACPRSSTCSRKYVYYKTKFYCPSHHYSTYAGVHVEREVHEISSHNLYRCTYGLSRNVSGENNKIVYPY